MVGVFDALSSEDEIGFGNWRLVKNSTTRSTRNRQRGGGWRRLFADETPYNNEDLHDQLTGRLSYYDTFSDHAMGGGDLSGYNYPYFYGSTLTPAFDVFPPAANIYCPVYFKDFPSGSYNGCPIFYPSVGYPYLYTPISVSLTGAAAHWRFDDIQAGTFVDNIAGVNLVNFGASVESGLIGNAGAFHVAEPDYAGVSSPVLDTGDITFGFTGWINRFANNLGVQEHILGRWAGAGFREYRLIKNAGNQLHFMVSSNGTDNIGAVNALVTQPNEWIFFACWHDKDANTVNLKINDGATLSIAHAGGVFAGASGQPFYIGLDEQTTFTFLDAKIDSLTFWKNRFPSEVELATLYHSGMGLDYPFSMGEGACNTGAPNYYQYSFLYTSCPVHYGSEVVPGYGYGPQFPVYSSQFSYDYVYCGDYLYFRQGCREAVTMLGEIVTSTGRKLIAGTMSRVYEYNQSAGNWRILADGLGNAGYTGEQCGCNSVRGSMATMGVYMLYTNTFDPPSIYVLGETQDNCIRRDLVPISDLVALDITRAGGVVVWKGFVIFFDITEDGTRLAGTFIWSALEQPDSYIESDTSLAGRITLAVGQTILAMEPLGNWLIAYTDKSIYRITLVGGEDIFNVEEIKGVGGNALKYKYSLINTGSAHLYLGESDVLYFTQFDIAPIHVPWITKAAGIIFNGMAEDDATYSPINRDACNLVTGGWSEEKREAWLSWPTGDNTCPNVTLRLNIKFNTADLVDHGFTSFLTFRADLRPTVGQVLEDWGVCPRGSKVAMGPKDGPPCSGLQPPVLNPPLYIRNPTENPDLPVHADSLCAKLVGKSMDDYCVDCSATPTFITASASDFTLKQQEDEVFYREQLGGSIVDYDGYACGGQYYAHEAYDTVLQTGAMDFRSDNEKILKRTTIEAFPEPQSTPSTLRCFVGYAAQASCPTWREGRAKDYECQTAMSAAQHAAAHTRPDDRFHFPFWARGKYLFSRFKIGGLGGAGVFSEVNVTVKEWESNTSR